VLISMFLTFSAAMGVVFTMKALIVVIMGGVGNMLGARSPGFCSAFRDAVARLVDPGLHRRHLCTVSQRPLVAADRPVRRPAR
jgi:branched-subunit amino acid ABC-type transport system permease component